MHLDVPKTAAANNGNNVICVFHWFTYAGHEISLEAACILCIEFLPNISVLPAKLPKHRDTFHPEYEDEDIRFLGVSMRP